MPAVVFCTKQQELVRSKTTLAEKLLIKRVPGRFRDMLALGRKDLGVVLSPPRNGQRPNDWQYSAFFSGFHVRKDEAAAQE
jgi:hypothetical protein